jgi:DNA-binding CsgD family transcriptional regulator
MTKSITAREREVVRLLAEGYSMAQAAATLRITPRSVSFHKYAVMKKLNLGTSAELVRFAVEQHTVGSL